MVGSREKGLGMSEIIVLSFIASGIVLSYAISYALDIFWILYASPAWDYMLEEISKYDGNK